jgi:serine/threonine-protein phosphatase 2B regulatory subunit
MGCGGSKKKKIVVDATKVMAEAADHAKAHGATSLHFTKLQVSAMAEKFATLHGDDKALTREQFRHMFNVDEDSLDILFEAFDIDHSGTLELSEMISGLSFFCRGSVEEKLKFLFDNHDADQSGFLEHSEILPMFQKLAAQLVRLEDSAKRRGSWHEKKGEIEMLDPDAIAQMANEFQTVSDLDGDGQISYDEFETFMETNELMKKFLTVMSKTGNALRESNAEIMKR